MPLQHRSNLEVSVREGRIRAAVSWDNRMGKGGNQLQRKILNPAIFHLIGSPKTKVIYDIACGNGHLARRLIRSGAREVWASDVSASMVAIARRKYRSRHIRYFVRNATNFKGIPSGKFDIILVNRAIGYIAKPGLLLRGIRRALKPGGIFIFTLSHPLKTVAFRGMGRKITLKTIIDAAEQYLKVGAPPLANLSGSFFENRIYRRPISSYVNLCSRYGLYINGIEEPISKSTFQPGYRHTNIPMYVVIKARKAS